MKANRFKMQPSARDTYLQKTYGITEAQYDEMLASQGGKCKICQIRSSQSDGRSLAVDHCHVSGAVRGILCYSCNTMLAKMRDTPECFDRAAAYLRAKLK